MGEAGRACNHLPSTGPTVALVHGAHTVHVTAFESLGLFVRIPEGADHRTGAILMAHGAGGGRLESSVLIDIVEAAMAIATADWSGFSYLVHRTNPRSRTPLHGFGDRYLPQGGW